MARIFNPFFCIGWWTDPVFPSQCYKLALVGRYIFCKSDSFGFAREVADLQRRSSTDAECCPDLRLLKEVADLQRRS